jgi:hypothetical protein
MADVHSFSAPSGLGAYSVKEQHRSVAYSSFLVSGLFCEQRKSSEYAEGRRNVALSDWVIGAGVIASAVGSMVLAVKARPEARKMDRDGAAAALTAGAGIVTASSTSYTNLLGRVTALETRLESAERRMRRHSRWDQTAVNRLQQHGIDLPDPPPLWDDEDGTAA